MHAMDMLGWWKRAGECPLPELNAQVSRGATISSPCGVHMLGDGGAWAERCRWVCSMQQQPRDLNRAEMSHCHPLSTLPSQDDSPPGGLVPQASVTVVSCCHSSTGPSKVTRLPDRHACIWSNGFSSHPSCIFLCLHAPPRKVAIPMCPLFSPVAVWVVGGGGYMHCILMPTTYRSLHGTPHVATRQLPAQA